MADVGPVMARILEATPHGAVIVSDGRIEGVNERATELVGPLKLGKLVIGQLPGWQPEGQWHPTGRESVRAWSVTVGNHSIALLEPTAEMDAELERLRETDHLKTQLLNTAAHELNTPITPLRLQVHLLENGTLGELTEPQRKSINILSRNITRISLLVKDILDVARVNAGELALDMQSVEIDQMLDDVFESFEEAAQQVNVTLQRGETVGAAIEADPNRMVQVLYNLVSNALKFTPSGGTVSMHAWVEDELIHVEVRDTGVGLTSKQISMLFQPFSQAHDPRDFSATGTGLGLYISKGLVEAHGGTIFATSDGLGQGSRFTVVLPRTEGIVVAPRAPVEAPAKNELLARLREFDLMAALAVWINIVLSSAAGILYAQVARAVLERPVTGSARTANISYAVWWMALAVTTIAAAVVQVIGIFDVWTLPGFSTYVHAVLFLIVLALASLLFYLVYLYTGKSGLVWPIALGYFVIWLALVYWIEWANPQAIVEGASGVELEFEQDPAGSVFASILGAVLLAPAIVAAGFYFRLYWKVDQTIQKFRIAVVSLSIFTWFLFSFVGALAGADDEAWWGVVTQVVAITAAAANYVAYRVPARLANWLGVNSSA